MPDTARNDVVPRRGVDGDEGGARLGHAGTPSVESDLPKGYRGAAERSSNVGVPAWPLVLLAKSNGHDHRTRDGAAEECIDAYD